MLNTYQIEMVSIICACCGERFWDWSDNTGTLCDYCTDYEPLDFDEYGEE